MFQPPNEKDEKAHNINVADKLTVKEDVTSDVIVVRVKASAPPGLRKNKTCSIRQIYHQFQLRQTLLLL